MNVPVKTHAMIATMSPVGITVRKRQIARNISVIGHRRLNLTVTTAPLLIDSLRI